MKRFNMGVALVLSLLLATPVQADDWFECKKSSSSDCTGTLYRGAGGDPIQIVVPPGGTLRPGAGDTFVTGEGGTWVYHPA